MRTAGTQGAAEPQAVNAGSVQAPIAFGALKPQVVVGVASARSRKGGRFRRGQPRAEEAPPSAEALKHKALMEKFDDERRA